MGLLDGLLGQVLGGMAQGGRTQGPSGMGGLGDLLNQMGGMPGMPGAGRGVPSQGGSALGGAAMGALVMLALQLLQRNGGLEGVLGRLREQGHAREADSWTSTGANEPISPDVLSQVFGREEIDRAARDTGLPPDEVAGGLASILPGLVDEMTPQGRVETGSDDVVTRALEILERNRGR